jgi:hypothetical protein
MLHPAQGEILREARRLDLEREHRDRARLGLARPSRFADPTDRHHAGSSGAARPPRSGWLPSLRAILAR